MTKTEKKNVIATMIYENIGYMYCDNCRYSTEQHTDDSCDDCHRKYNGWGISKYEANRIAKQIIDLN